MNENYTYCKGKGCALRVRCRRYTEGLRIPATNFGWWMEQCEAETRDGYDDIGN